MLSLGWIVIPSFDETIDSKVSENDTTRSFADDSQIQSLSGCSYESCRARKQASN